VFAAHAPPLSIPTPAGGQGDGRVRPRRARLEAAREPEQLGQEHAPCERMINDSTACPDGCTSRSIVKSKLRGVLEVQEPLGS